MMEDRAGLAANEAEMRTVRLRYGVNESDSWWHFALGPERERIWQLHREMGTQIIRIFLFDKNAPDPLAEWDLFRSYVNAVLAVGATPLVTYAKFRRPLDDSRAVRWFAEQCGRSSGIASKNGARSACAIGTGAFGTSRTALSSGSPFPTPAVL